MKILIYGLVTGIFGTHTHVQTADEKILPHGTAYITDAGMTESGLIPARASILIQILNPMVRSWHC